ncbi:hypothetical protein ARAM_000285 [Aspergillus rambellii]|uniref:NTP binding protein n=1 Tax=Aspergillus rambellii TaxID=308745 RepID=A0A0F8V4N3_9EURO|nr:hypothetical protein ARAM_000285 [Aspergillus rambellii]
MTLNTPQDHPDSDSDDAILKALEDEDDPAYRASRIEQLNAEFASSQYDPRTSAGAPSSSATTAAAAVATLMVQQDTLYPTLISDPTILDFTTQTNRCVIHFAHPDFAKCGVMDEHIRALASRHHEVKFARVDVRHAPFIVEKLKIRVLPCVIGFKDGVGVERVVGFEGLGVGGRDGASGFSTATLERRLVFKGVLGQAKFRAGESGGLSDEEDEEDDESGSEGEGGGRRRRRRPRRRGIRTGNARGSGRRDNQADDDDDDDDWD